MASKKQESQVTLTHNACMYVVTYNTESKKKTRAKKLASLTLKLTSCLSVLTSCLSVLTSCLSVQEYVSLYPDQSPAPFVILAKQLPMGVSYESDSIDITSASVVDRLRKQAKTRAIKVVRELIYDAASGITSAMLRGYKGAVKPAHNLEPLIT